MWQVLKKVYKWLFLDDVKEVIEEPCRYVHKARILWEPPVKPVPVKEPVQPEEKPRKWDYKMSYAEWKEQNQLLTKYFTHA